MQSRTIISCRLTRCSIAKQQSSASRSFAHLAALNDASSHLPRIARPSLWRSLVPRFLRKRTHDEDAAIGDTPIKHVYRRTKRTGASVAVLGVIVGSFAINVIALRRELLTFSRKTEAKLDLLREVLRRVKSGEQVDVKKLLGTGDPQQEKEWEELVQELENYNRSAAKEPKSSDHGIAGQVKHVWTSLFQASEREKTSTQETTSEAQNHQSSNKSQPKYLM